MRSPSKKPFVTWQFDCARTEPILASFFAITVFGRADAVAESDELRMRAVAKLLEAAGVESERACVRAKTVM